MAVAVLYIPVLHQGYTAFLNQLSSPREVYLLPPDLAQEFTPVHKEIRALSMDQIQAALESWHIVDSITTATVENLKALNTAQVPVHIPNELVSKEICARSLPDCPVTVSSIFLRWDSALALEQKTLHPDAFFSQAQLEGSLSSDWWRQVGAVAVSNGEIVGRAHNTHLPTEQQPYVEGDPRGHFHKGDHIELTTAIHAEAKLIGHAAAIGQALAGCDLYVTDFPCPPCAKLVAEAQVRRLFYQKGYAMLDGERILKSAGVELIQVTE